MGAKLQYLESLKGECPEGQHLEYMKAGGKVCKRCMMDNPVPHQFAKKKKAKVSVVQSDMKEKGSKKALPMAKCGGKNKIGKKMNGGTLTQQFMNTYIK